MNRRSAAIIVASIAGTLLVLGSGLLFLVYSGEYNVAASKPHYSMVGWALETAMERSVRDHADEIRVPPLSDPELLRTGFEHFQAMCVTCHGAPGKERSEIGKGLTPSPPELAKEVREWSPAELFWIVKHGIKMSGMPAFGPTHDDRTIWGIVALLQRLPETTPEQYRAMEARAGGGGEGHGHQHSQSGDGAAQSGSAEEGGGGGGHEHAGEHEHEDGHSH
jgi:mono/diheme cytochrome c family protein